MSASEHFKKAVATAHSRKGPAFNDDQDVQEIDLENEIDEKSQIKKCMILKKA